MDQVSTLPSAISSSASASIYIPPLFSALSHPICSRISWHRSVPQAVGRLPITLEGTTATPTSILQVIAPHRIGTLAKSLESYVEYFRPRGKDPDYLTIARAPVIFHGAAVKFPLLPCRRIEFLHRHKKKSRPSSDASSRIINLPAVLLLLRFSVARPFRRRSRDPDVNDPATAAPLSSSRAHGFFWRRCALFLVPRGRPSLELVFPADLGTAVCTCATKMALQKKSKMMNVNQLHNPARNFARASLESPWWTGMLITTPRRRKSEAIFRVSISRQPNRCMHTSSATAK